MSQHGAGSYVKLPCVSLSRPDPASGLQACICATTIWLVAHTSMIAGARTIVVAARARAACACWLPPPSHRRLYCNPSPGTANTNCGVSWRSAGRPRYGAWDTSMQLQHVLSEVELGLCLRLASEWANTDRAATCLDGPARRARGGGGRGHSCIGHSLVPPCGEEVWGLGQPQELRLRAVGARHRFSTPCAIGPARRPPFADGLRSSPVPGHQCLLCVACCVEQMIPPFSTDTYAARPITPFASSAVAQRRVCAEL